METDEDGEVTEIPQNTSEFYIFENQPLCMIVVRSRRSSCSIFVSLIDLCVVIGLVGIQNVIPIQLSPTVTLMIQVFEIFILPLKTGILFRHFSKIAPDRQTVCCLIATTTLFRMCIWTE